MRLLNVHLFSLLMVILFSQECNGFVPPAIIMYRHDVQLMQRYLSTNLNDDSILGLTDDGDFAILGINYEDPMSSTTKGNDDDDASIEQPLGGALLQQLLGGSSFDTLDTNIISPPNRTPSALTTSEDDDYGRFVTVQSSSSSSSSPIRRNNQIQEPSNTVVVENNNMEMIEEEIEKLQSWLLEIIPTLNERDLELYARGLVSIGFDPVCVTQSELQIEDLKFMKILHRRYLYNEICGIDHPWDA